MAARRSRAPATGLEEHAARVAHLAVLTAHQLRVSEADVERIHLAALLHDVGKTAIPDSLLVKPGALDALEWELMRTHTLIKSRRARASSPCAMPSMR